jgi:hypothetical protein
MVTYNCKQIEELILKQTTEMLAQNEIKIIKVHLENCSSCKAFQLTISKMETSMQVQSDTSLQPDTAIRETVIKQMKELSASKISWLNDFVNAIRSILEYRIPVYQAGLAIFIVIFIVMFGFDFSNSLIDKNEVSPVIAQNVEYPIGNEYLIENYPELENQKVGVNVREDSILIRFIYTSM